MKGMKSNNKRVQLVIRCKDEAEREALKKAAHKAFGSLNTWALKVLRKAAGLS